MNEWKSDLQIQIFISLNWVKSLLKNKSIKSFLVSKDNISQNEDILNSYG